MALIADYFVVCNGQSNRQLKAIADGVVKAAKDAGQRALSVEGDSDSGWVLVDFGAVVVHVFSVELRQYYKLEELWHEAQVVVRMQ